ncbi:MAG: hypothetical protein HY774_08110 [Acidobacteria bacterium]|nr:hypothetical protein [Acidobacteriota bacterium]
MKKVLFCIVTIWLMVFSTLVFAQEALTNEAIVKLVKGEFGEELIINMINTQAGNYRVTPDDILSLKEQGVSEKILNAMVNKGVAPAPSKPGGSEGSGASNKYPMEVGLYIKKENEWVEIQPEIVNWKTGGVLKNLATAGIVKGDINGNLSGNKSRNRVGTPLEFLIYAPEGVAITEYQLLKLRENKEYREFRTVTGGVFHIKGGATRDLVPFEGKKVATRTFTVNLTALAPGEYGFLPPGAFSSAASSSTLGKIYTFSFTE